MTEPDDDARTRMLPRQSRSDPDRTQRMTARAWSETDEKLPDEEADEARIGEPRIEIIPAAATTGSRPGVSTGDHQAVRDTETTSPGGAAAAGDKPADGRTDPADSTVSPDATSDPWYVTLRRRIPEHILGGRMRTSTMFLIVLWVALVVLYGWLNPNGSGGDSTTTPSAETNVIIPDGYQLTQVPAAPQTTAEPTVTTTESPTTTSGTETTTTSESEVGSGEGTEATTTAPGITLPGLSIPGLTGDDADSTQTTSSP